MPYESEEAVQGFLDETNRALLTVDFGQGPLDLVIDTGFDGAFLVGEEFFDESKAVAHAGHIFADLASDQALQYDAWFVEFAWMGEETRTRVMVGPGTDCLIGTALLEPHRLEIDYEKRTVDLIRGSSW